MRVRHAACDPCRKAKLSCDHKLPACGRCTARLQAGSCVYRARPFRRKGSTTPGTSVNLVPSLPPCTSSTNHSDESHEIDVPTGELNSQASLHRYPNPGFLGASSHSAIFKQLTTHSESTLHQQRDNAEGWASSATFRSGSEGDSVRVQDIQTLTRLGQVDVHSIVRLLNTWTATGADLALAQPFIQCSTTAILSLYESLVAVLAQPDDQTRQLVSMANVLVENTRTSLGLTRDSTINDLVGYLSSNVRWEVIGFFVTAAGRACAETPAFPGLYINGEQRRRLARTLVSLSDACLDTCISLDTLTDLQLVLQFENGILHSQVHGDQSLVSWRSTGDMASSLFALGYHEKIVHEGAPDVPEFLAELRKACFARIYAADKEVAIFLGRPPRIIGEYCVFRVPEWSSLPWDHYVRSGTAAGAGAGAGPGTGTGAQTSAAINYTADTRRVARFARIKEEIMQLLRDRQRASGEDKLSLLRRKIEEEWEALPSHFRLTTSLRDCRHHAPFERDFLAASRLDYLHASFLLDLASQKKVSEPDEAIVCTAAKMLSLVVEVIILRDSLVNSGSSLVWKVAHFGLPAAGVISLALLNTSFAASGYAERFRMVQNLTVLNAEITIGAWIQAGDANYSLFEQAANTLKILLESKIPLGPHPDQPEPQQAPDAPGSDQWDPYSDLQPWDFEMDFWANLAEHPTLMGEIV